MRKRIGKRLVSAVLAVSMIVSMMPVQAFAKGMPRAESTVEILKQENDAGMTDDIIEIKIGSGISFGEAPSTDNMNTEFWSYGTNLLGIKTLTLKKGQFKLTGGALQDEIKLSIESGATFVDGKVNGEVFNAGTIEGGTFSHALPHTSMNVGPNGSKTQWVGGIVRNSGTITGGTFKGQLWNGGVVSGGVIYGEVYNKGEITGTSEFAVTKDDYGNRGGNPSKYGIIKNLEGGIISGGSFGKNCQVTNQGTISGGKFEIGRFYYQIENSGGTITGGQFADCKVLNGVLNNISGTISGGMFDNGYTVSNSGGVISGGTFRKGAVNNTGAGTKVGIVRGGVFSGTVTCDKWSKIEDGVFIGDVTGPTIYGGVFKNEPDAYYLSAAVRYANGTTTFSLLKNGNADVSGVLENVTVLYVASDTLAKEITIVPSTDVIDVSGNIKYNGKAGGPMQLRMEMRGKSNDLVLNSITKKIPKYEDFRWDQAQRKVVSDVPGMGVVTTYYKKTFIMPTQPGSYKITYKVAESEDYIAFEGPDDTGWTLNLYTVTVDGGTADNTVAAAGDTITLTRGNAPEGYSFAYWTLNDEKIEGDTFTMPDCNAVLKAHYDINSYILTVNGVPETKTYGDSVSVTAEDKVGHSFSSWTVKGMTVEDASSKTLEFTMPASDVTLTANYTPNLYELTVDGRTVQKEYDAEVTVTAKDEVGHTFTGWTVEGVTVEDKTSQTLHFRMPAKEVKLTTNYSTNQYTLVENGRADKRYYYDWVTLQAQSWTGQTFDHWEISGVEISEEEAKKSYLTFRMPANDVTAEAIYTIDLYAVEVEGGRAEVDGKTVTAVPYGKTVTLVPEPEPGKEFVRWKVVGDNTNLSIMRNSFTMPYWNVKIKAVYKDIYYTITITGGNASSENYKKATDAKYNERIYLEAVPENVGDELDYWEVNGQKIDGSEFNMPAENVTIRAVWKRAIYKLTLEGATATVNGNPASTAQYGDNVWLTAEPPYGKELARWELSGLDGTKTIKFGRMLNFKMPANDVTAKAIYEDGVYSIFITGGTVDNTEHKAGELVLVQVDETQFPEGQTFKEWETAPELDMQPTDGGYTFTMPGESVTIKAVYQNRFYDLTVDGKTESREYGSLVNVTAPEKEGYTFAGWTVKGAQVDNPYNQTLLFRMPAGDVTLTPNYTANKYSLTVDDTMEFKDYGEPVTVTAPEKEGYTFTDWAVDGVTVADKTSKTLAFTMPAGDVTLTANYAINHYTLTVNGKAEPKEYGEYVYTYAEDRTGWIFTGWEATGLELTAEEKADRGIVFYMPAHDVTLTALYEAEKYTLSVTDGTPENTTAVAGTEVTLTANAPAKGMQFDHWILSDDLEIVSGSLTDTTITVKMPQGYAYAIASYTFAPQYMLKIVMDDDYEFQSLTADEEVVLTAKEPAKGRQFDQWKLSEGLELVSGALTDATIKVRMPAKEASAEAVYKEIPKRKYTLTVTNGTPTSRQEEAGTEVVLTANAPAEGKLFDQWELSENLTLVSGNLTDETITVRMPEGNATAKATYKDAPKPEYTLTVTSGTPASTTAKAGTEVTLTANTPAEGKLFDQWELSENLTLISGNLTDETITVRMPEGNATAKATYKDAPKPEYTLTVTSGTPASTTAKAGTEVTLTANTPAEGKLFDQWELSENLTLISGNLTDETITVRMPEGNATAKATYKDAPKPEPEPYTIEVQDGTAFVNGAEAAAALAGTEITIHAKAAPEGMKFSGWQVETPQTLELKDGTAAKTTFIMPDACVKISALYTTSEVPDPTPDASGGGAAIAAAAVGAAAGAAIGIGVWAVNRYILSNLPVGMAVPTTRQQLAVVLWTMAGKPDVTPTVHYQDVVGLDAQKAVHWAVEQQLMQPESAEYFGAQGSVNKWQVFQLMKQVMK